MGNPFPNPTSNQISIPYSLPNEEKTGIIKIFDISGKEMKSYSVDSNFQNITLNASELPSGTYYYQLETSKGKIGGKKVIKLQ